MQTTFFGTVMATETQRRSNVRRKMDSLRLAALFAGGCLVLGCQRAGERNDYQPRVAPEVSSRQLVRTEIVPTLDTPLGKSGNAVWCATFQIAWNRARDEVIGGPLQVANAQRLANRLNNSPVTEAALPSGSYFAAAGRLEDGILETIRRGMARQFPDVHLPDFSGAVGFVTYGYLDTKVTFRTPFVDTIQPIEFSDAAGVTHSVRGFGLQEGDWDLCAKQAAQVKVLFSQGDDESDGSSLSAFALDLTADQTEQQVIVAVLPRAGHLRSALDDLATRIEKSAPDNEHSARLQESDTLAIPNVSFHVNHEFSQLQGVDKIIENSGEFKGLYIMNAAQSIRFRLDKSGATVVSKSHMTLAADPRHFVVDRPFLIVMKRRSSEQPFFVAWIDNVELVE